MRCSNTLVYGFTTADRPEHCVIFWDMKTDDKYKKYVRKLVGMRASGENCVLAKADDTGVHTATAKATTT